jgi:hypothetical protein
MCKSLQWVSKRSLEYIKRLNTYFDADSIDEGKKKSLLEKNYI